MTYTWSIDCHKWWIRIGLTLWALATIGLGFGVYYGYQYATIGDPLMQANCNNLPSDWKQMCLHNHITDSSLLYLTIAGNIGNVIGMWFMINRKYKFIIIKCVDKRLSITTKKDLTT